MPFVSQFVNRSISWWIYPQKVSTLWCHNFQLWHPKFGMEVKSVCLCEGVCSCQLAKRGNGSVQMAAYNFQMAVADRSYCEFMLGYDWIMQLIVQFS